MKKGLTSNIQVYPSKWKTIPDMMKDDRSKSTGDSEDIDAPLAKKILTPHAESSVVKIKLEQ